MARWHKDTYPIGYNKEKAIMIIKELNKGHRPNLELRGKDLFVCWNNHGKGEACYYELLTAKAI